ncbi:MAG: efflux RND transporter permease subunit [Acidobacteriota bacterium]|nr:efflux RND transporter permease subunit [Acidobacteriota bacterium]
MIAISLKRPVTVSMFVAALLVFGVISYTNLGRDLLPDIAYPSLTIMTRYEGAAPEEVEQYITDRLEASLATVKGKRRLTSISREGVSLITIEFEWGHDMQIATLHVREKLDNARFSTGFPEDADRPTILRWDPSAKPIVGLAVTGDADILQLKEGVREIIKPRLEQVEGIAMAQISGDIERVIDVEVDREKLTLYGISLDQISNAISRANANIPGGTIKKGRYRYTLRTLGEFDSVEQINTVVVTRRNNVDVRISDIAYVRDTHKDREAMATVNSTEAIGLLVYKEAGANTIEATKMAKDLVTELNKTNKDYQITLAFEEAKFIEQALNNVWVSVIFGGLFAFLVLILFLRDLKSPIFIFISIPIAIITTLVLMYFQGISLNIMSLGGLALGVGMLVDNSIVVLENIYRHREAGMKPMKAAYQGAKEVALPVAASTFTTIAVFFPIVYLKGVAGALFGEQAWTVTFSLLSSLVVSLTVLPLLTALATILEGRDSFPARLTPMPKAESGTYPRGIGFWKWWEFLIAAMVLMFVAAHFKVEWEKSLIYVGALAVLPVALFLLKWIMTVLLSLLFQMFAMLLFIVKTGAQWVLDKIFIPVFDFFYDAFEHAYHATLAWCLERKLITLTVSIGLIFLTVTAGKELKRELMPRSASGQFTIEAKLPEGTALEITSTVISELEQMLLADEAVDVVFSQMGASEANLAQLLRDSGTNTAEISVKLKEAYISLEEVYRLSEMVREAATKYDRMKVDFTETESSFEELLASEGGSGFVVQIDGENFEELYEANDKVMSALAEVSGLKDLKSSLARNSPQLKVDINRDAVARYGFDISSVGGYLSDGMRGDVATQYKEFDRQIDVRVRFPIDDRENFERVLGATMTSPNGTPIPLRDLLIVQNVRAAKEIRRINQRRVALISANLAGVKISDVVPEVQEKLDALTLPPGVSRPRITGEQEGMQNSFGQLIFAFGLSCLLVYMIMAGQFESLRFPFVVIFTLPMGLVGTVFMLYTFDQSINIMSLIGLIVLSGIVVNDAIVKVDFINQAREGGDSIREAVLRASRVRLRPILMTTATTVLGLLPMASGLVSKFMESNFMKPLVAQIDKQLLELGWIPMAELFSSRGAEIQRPLALVVIGGLSMATMLTLILIPIFYEMFSGKDVHVKPEKPAAEAGGEAAAEVTP